MARCLPDLLAATAGTPLRCDFSVLVREDAAAGRSSYLVLRLYGDEGEELGAARVYSNEWYPGREDREPWSHYFPTLRHVLEGLRKGGETALLRLQVLKAVPVPSRARGLEPVFLKFIIAPEYAVNASALEHTYGCALRTYYNGFVGVERDPRAPATSAEWVVGNAIHAGYRSAAQGYVRGESRESLTEGYLAAVRETWIAEFSALVGVESAGPTRLHTRPVGALGSVLERCREQWEGEGDVRLLQERLFYSPRRGLLGKADRITYATSAVSLHEVKTGASGGERDPGTGRTVPGGVQAAAYFEIMRALGNPADGAYVEQLGTGDVWEETALVDHPVVSRARALHKRLGHDRYTDLLAQNRNVAYCLESGLLTGYDRTLINAIGNFGRSPKAVGGDYELSSSQAPCRMCEVNSRGVCPATRAPSPSVRYNLFRYLPEPLWAYWVWFHRALKVEDAATRTALHHLVTTPPQQLEQSEGVTISGLTVQHTAGRHARLGRAARIDTRLREDDRVLLTPQHVRPGEVYSVDGTVTALGENTIELSLNDVPDSRAGLYQVDRLGYWERNSWQVQGLTDFLLRSATEAGVGGRQLELRDLPSLSRRLLGELPPGTISENLSPPSPRLNEEHRRAIGAALALAPGDVMLVQGPPGTGKTGMVAHLVERVMEERFFSDGPRPILLLANTHRAADEVTLRLHREFPELRPYLVRVGRARHGMEPEVREHLLSEMVGVCAGLESVDLRAEGPSALWRLAREGRLRLEHAGVFVGTLAAARAGELKGLEFEWVVVDEAGQATEPAALQALRHMPFGFASRLLLVGDHMQLPPVVPEEQPDTEPAGLEGMGLLLGDGLRTSMFERLARIWPHAVLTLHKQYRMNDAICEVVSDTFYDGELVPGTEEVAKRSLAETLNELGGSIPTSDLLSPGFPVVFVDTSFDDRAAEQAGAGEESRSNPFEARIVARLVWELSGCVPEDAVGRLLAEVGVISAYRRQNNLIRQELRRLHTTLAEVRVDTVDRFQGGERDVMFVSLVNNGSALGRLHSDARRMNVAISRARRKLVIVGDRGTFTTEGSAEEEPARERYRLMLETIDGLAAQGRALVVDSRTLL